METEIRISPAFVADRLRKLQQNMTDENRHDEAFLIEVAVETIRSLMKDEGKSFHETVTELRERHG